MAGEGGGGGDARMTTRWLTLAIAASALAACNSDRAPAKAAGPAAPAPPASSPGPSAPSASAPPAAPAAPSGHAAPSGPAAPSGHAASAADPPDGQRCLPVNVCD